MELDAAFNKYDRSGYGEIDMKDVGKVLRWMGYTASFNVQLMLIKEVDIDESGTLDIVEARKLVRKFQEKELTAWTATFHSAVSATSRKYLEVETCVHTLRSLGIKATVEQVEEIRQELAVRLQVNKQRRFSTILPSPTIDLMPAKSVLLKPSQEEADESSSSFADASSSSEEESEPEVTMSSQASGHEFTDKIDLAVFHLICAKLVAQAKEASRDNAGYTLDECQRMRETFAKYDVNKSGDIDNYEMSKLVQDLCPDLATNMAKRAEITRILSEVAPPKHGSFDFPDFLRLMRQVDDMQDRIRMAKESFAIEKTNFSSREVEEFRRLFLGEEDMNGSFRGMLRIDEFLSLLAPVLGTSPARQELTRLFFDIDSHMHPDHAQKVVAPMSPKGSLGGHHYKAQPVNKPRIALDFPEFLILMHLVLEKNVCQVKEHCKTILECGRRFSHRPSRLH
ncbi:unnamed protein product [Effrenium voratum]|uniref:Calmodulin n=1 Tax=Effrenium voratum TaxID=2562239 RepID=A0AA36J3N6_9DINO|nr:unnamed protein product [Effrenium voratum]CAJ1397948.1 unnamed protein product [Effrenium voratum]